jgi:HSP20 family protein
MTLVRWTDPFRDFVHLQDRFDRAFGHAQDRDNAWVPPVDIFQNGDHEVVLKAELPDMTREEIDITVENFTLTIKGEKKAPAERNDQFHRIERPYGPFTRSFSLPQTVDAAKVSADYRNGVLTIRLPLREEAKPRQIKIDVAA